MEPRTLPLIQVTWLGKPEVTGNLSEVKQQLKWPGGPGHRLLTEATLSPPRTYVDKHTEDLQGQQQREEQKPGKLLCARNL